MTRGKETYVGAYLVQGGTETLNAVVEKLVREGYVEKGSPDVYVRVYRSFGVEEARELRERAGRKSISGTGRVFAFFVPGMTTDAQNALLKVLEEPPAHALFFIVTLSPEMFLPTLLSRMQTLSLLDVYPEDSMVDVDAFLKATLQKRLDMLKPLYEHDESEGRDIGGVITFLQALERRLAKEKLSPASKRGLEALYRARKFVGDKGSMLKALLEQTALVLPKV